MDPCPSSRPRAAPRPPRALLLALLAALTPTSPAHATISVTDVRYWSLGDVTRIAVETTGEFSFKYRRLANPDRIYFDILNSTQRVSSDTTHVIDVNDGLVKQIRVAQNRRTVTRVVVDLAPSVGVSASYLANPDRLIIEVRSPAAPPAAGAAPASPTTLDPPAAEEPPPRAATAPALPEQTRIAAPAKRNQSGRRSLTRVLGLKLGRVVIDPGHGGRDTGTIGPSGLMEKDVVLDVATRLKALIEERLDSEAILTRTGDVSLPLEARTQLANDQQADLFLSIHVNSSRYRAVGGVETFYLNFTESRADLELAARENAGSNRSIHELSDLVRKIALDDKIQESRDFAAAVQKSLHALLRKHNPGAKNRGVKKAPFVVLIDAEMPSVLVELGFISNPKEEKLMANPDHRQAIAEALFQGLADYASTLSHFQVARSGGDPQ